MKKLVPFLRLTRSWSSNALLAGLLTAAVVATPQTTMARTVAIQPPAAAVAGRGKPKALSAITEVATEQ